MFGLYKGLAMSLNKVLLVGRLGRDPELQYTGSGVAVCNFSIATSENWKDKDGNKQEKTEWHRIKAFGKIGEICHQYLAKGREVFIEGKLQTREWEDKAGGKRTTTEVMATEVQFLGSASSKGDSAPVEKPQASNGNAAFGGTDYSKKPVASQETFYDTDDIPF